MPDGSEFGSDFAWALHGDGASYRDARMHAIFAMAPSLGPAVTADSLGKIKIPTVIVAGEADSVVPVDANAKYYAGITTHSVCTGEGRSALPALCVDHPGVDRAAIHDAVANLAAKFFGVHL